MIIQRKDYIEKINPFVNKHIIKVLIGTRRSGKSTILKQIIDSLIKQGIPKEKRTQINKIRNERGGITTDTTEIKRIIRD